MKRNPDSDGGKSSEGQMKHSDERSVNKNARMTREIYLT